MKDRRTTNILLMIIVIPIIFYLLKILSFIFIPLVFSMFIALLFLPLMRWLNNRKIPKPISIIIVVLIIAAFLKIGGVFINLSSNEILATDDMFLEKVRSKLNMLMDHIEGFFGLENIERGNFLAQFFNKDNLLSNFNTTVGFIANTITMILMTVFFVILWLAESINFQKVLKNTIFIHNYSSVKAFMKMENDLIKFIKVKFFVSLFTGIGTGLACLFFDINFPIFWGLFAFLINFVQLVGSIVTVVLLSVFAFVELDPSSTLLFFIITITGVQVLFGSILEPIFMGKSFSINVITILVMLMLWGYLWGVPGMIMSIPITVFIKFILEQFSDTKGLARLMSVSKS